MLNVRVRQLLISNENGLRRSKIKVETKLNKLRGAYDLLINNELIVGIYEEHIIEVVKESLDVDYRALSFINITRFDNELDIYIDLIKLMINEKIRIDDIDITNFNKKYVKCSGCEGYILLKNFKKIGDRPLIRGICECGANNDYYECAVCKRYMINYKELGICKCSNTKEEIKGKE